MSVVSFLPDPYAVHVLDVEGNETDVPASLIAVLGNEGLVERERELFWIKLERIRVIYAEPPPVGPPPEG